MASTVWGMRISICSDLMVRPAAAQAVLHINGGEHLCLWIVHGDRHVHRLACN